MGCSSNRMQIGSPGVVLEELECSGERVDGLLLDAITSLECYWHSTSAGCKSVDWIGVGDIRNVLEQHW
jgi:hypothetical protein